MQDQNREGKDQLVGTKALILADNGFEDIQLLYIYNRLVEAGFFVRICSPSSGEITGEHGYRVRTDFGTRDPSLIDFEIIAIPGGKSIENLKDDKGTLNLVQDFFSSARYLAAIAEGARVLAFADILSGIKVTSIPDLKGELVKAGADFVNEQVMIDERIITSRGTHDLPYFCRSIISKFEITSEMVDRIGPDPTQ